jgi:hypothetical protein
MNTNPSLEDIVYNTLQSVIQEILTPPPPHSLQETINTSIRNRQRTNIRDESSRTPYRNTNVQENRHDEMYLHNIALHHSLRDVLTDYNANFRHYTQTIQSYLETIRTIQSYQPSIFEDNRYRDNSPPLRRHTYRTPPTTTQPLFHFDSTPTTTTTTSTQYRTPSLPQRSTGRYQTHNRRSLNQPILFSTFFGEDTVQRPTEVEIDRALRLFPFESSDFNILESSCPITLENFQEGEQIAQITYCGHIFRERAIRHWLRRTYGCPICRQDIRGTPSTTRTTTSAMDLSMNRIPVLNSMSEIDQLFENITNRFSTMVNDQAEYDMSMNMVFTFPVLLYDMSFGNTIASTMDTGVD